MLIISIHLGNFECAADKQWYSISKWQICRLLSFLKVLLEDETEQQLVSVICIFEIKVSKWHT